MGWKSIPLWHSNALGEHVDVIFLPGGFSYGDYLRCGALARFSPAMESVRSHARRGGLLMGICNGFQILCEAGLLPGALTRNSGLQFRCLWTSLRAVAQNSFTQACATDAVLRIPIAHGEGRFHIDPDGLARLREGNQIAFVYTGEEENPNGSVANIAGITNEEGNILGMMPHPERAMETALGGTDGRGLFQSIEHALSKAGV